jgi:hypothetical protein
LLLGFGAVVRGNYLEVFIMKRIFVVLMIVAIGTGLGYFLYQKNVSSNSDDMAVKALLDRVETTPVTSAEARAAFRTIVRNVCRINGVDPKNGYGTTEECYARIDTNSDSMCAAKVPKFENKTYHSKTELMSDFKIYGDCALSDIVRERKL